MNFNRPRKKAVIVFIACLVLVGGIFAFLEYRNRAKIYAEGSLEALIAIQNKMIESDQDADGLKDWEETLWKTDPKNPDSDGDGMMDGEEVDQNRDPAKAGPDDKLSPETVTKNEEQAERIKNDTVRFSEAILTKFLAIQQTGGDQTDVENYEDIVNLFLEEAEQAENLKLYGVADIKVVTETPDSIKNYGNDLGRLLITEKPPAFENELIVFNRAVENEDDEELIKLDLNIAEYKRIRDGLLQMDIPQTFSAPHLDLLNTVETLIYGVTAMRNSDTDPLHSIAGIERYPGAANSFIPLLQKIASDIQASRVVFAQSEPGNNFLSVIINPQFIPTE